LHVFLIKVERLKVEKLQLIDLTTHTANALVKNNEGQSNLAIGGIAANWGFRLPNLPFPWGPSDTMLPGTTQVSLPNDISSLLTALTEGHECDRYTEGQIPRYGNICRGIAFNNAAKKALLLQKQFSKNPKILK